MRKLITSLSLIVGCASASAADEPLTLTMRALSVDTAAKIATNALADCTKRGFKVATAVVGRDGNLLAFLRNPLAGPHTIQVSQQKAYASASFQVPTSAMGEMRDLAFAPGVILAVGGVPIEVAGHFYGGVAVSGADPKTDEVCAQAGVDAVREQLEFAD